MSGWSGGNPCPRNNCVRRIKEGWGKDTKINDLYKLKFQARKADNLMISKKTKNMFQPNLLVYFTSFYSIAANRKGKFMVTKKKLQWN